MNLVSKKNLQEGEVVIYIPKTHPIIMFRPFSILLISFFIYAGVEFIALISSLLVEDTVRGIVYFILRIILVTNIVVAGFYFIWALIEYVSVEYYLTNKRLILKNRLFFRNGFLSTTIIDMPIEKIESIKCHQNLFGHILNYGTVIVSGVGCMLPRYSTIEKPLILRRKINEIIEKNRKITVIRKDGPKPRTVVKEKIIDIDYGIFVTSYPSEGK